MKISTYSNIAKVVGLALVLAFVTTKSIQKLTHASDGNYSFTVTVYEGDPANNIKVVNANVLLVADDRSNTSHGLNANTDGSGNVSFNSVQSGSFNVEIRAVNYDGRDYHVDLDSDTTLSASLTHSGQPDVVTPEAQADCNSGAGLTGQITDHSSTGGTATARVTNLSTCTYQIGFASYQVYSSNPDERTSQKLVDSRSMSIAPNQTITSDLNISIPNCKYQLDLFRGPVLAVPVYEPVFMDYFVSSDAVCATAPAPTPAPVVVTPTPTPTATPTPTPTPVVVVETPVCTTGTVNITTNLSAGTYTLTGPNNVSVTGNNSQSLNNLSAGDYTFTANDVSGYTKTVNNTNASLAACGSVNFTVVYNLIPVVTPTPTPTPVACTTGTIVVNTNLANASYTVSGYNAYFAGTGTQSFNNNVAGNYTFNASDVAGYTKTVSQTSGYLSACGALYFTVNYQVNPVAAPVQPQVAGVVFVAPKTGSTATLIYILASLSVVMFAVYKNRESLMTLVRARA